MSMRFAIFGGTGFIGSKWIQHALQNGDEVVLFTRRPDQVHVREHASLTVRGWPLEDPLKVDGVINLAGETINQRWTPKAKQRIVESRKNTTARIVTEILKGTLLTKALINGSAVGFYGQSLDSTFTETDKPLREKNDFLGEVTDVWEAEAEKVLEKSGIRLVKARFGVVLGVDGGAFPRMVLPYRLFAGGPIGNGQQWLSWIHISDVVRLLDFCLKNEMVGPVNFTAPQPTTMDQFGKSIADVLHRPHWIPLPSFVLKGMLGEMSDLLLKGQKVLPQKALNHGFSFDFPTTQQAISELLLDN